MQTNYAYSGNPALRQGLLFGLLLTLFTIVFNAILSLVGWSIWFIGVTMTTNTATGRFISIVGFVVAVLAYLIAGRRAAQQTGRVGTGASAGSWAGFVAATITSVYSLIYYATTTTPVHPFTVSEFVFSAVTSIILTMLGGAVIGALGGLLRKSTSLRRTR
ncbi:MAG: hypothetical protein ABI406_05355 [Ktedonobacteraceae bacterium]